MIDHLSQFTGSLTGQAHRSHAQLRSYLDRGQHIFRASTGGDGDEHIPRSSQGLNLASKYLLKAIVITQTGEYRRIYRQSNGRPGWSLAPETPDQLGCEMLRIGGTAPVATNKYLAACL